MRNFAVLLTGPAVLLIAVHFTLLINEEATAKVLPTLSENPSSHGNSRRVVSTNKPVDRSRHSKSSKQRAADDENPRQKRLVVPKKLSSGAGPGSTTTLPYRVTAKQAVRKTKTKATTTTTTTTPAPPTTVVVEQIEDEPDEEEEAGDDDETETDDGVIEGDEQAENSETTQQSFVLDNHTASYTWESLLLRHLFEDREYSNKARPAVYNGIPVNVSLEMVLLKINELIEIDQEILISGFLKISWVDSRLTWNKEDFGGIDWIISDIGYIWLPDLALINSDDVYALTRDNRFPIRISSNGNVLFVPAGKISARCELDLSYFPFDEQMCKYRFESWIYTSDLVLITGVNLTIDNKHFVQNPQWSILDAFVRSRIVGYEHYNFSQVDFYVFLKRKSLFFITYTVFPSVIISSLQIMSHLLPFTESERINFGTTTLIAFSVFHISVVEQVPKSSEFIPLLAIYVDSLMCLIGLSLMECFLIMNWIARVGLTVPQPMMWYWIVEVFGRFLWLGSSGKHWRRKYLQVLFKVNAERDLIAKTERDMKWADEQRRARFLRDRVRRMSSSIVEFRGFGRADIFALSRLSSTWGVPTVEERTSPRHQRSHEDPQSDINNSENNNNSSRQSSVSGSSRRRHASPAGSTESVNRATPLISKKINNISNNKEGCCHQGSSDGNERQPQSRRNLSQTQQQPRRRNLSCSPRLQSIPSEMPASQSVHEQMAKDVDDAFKRINSNQGAHRSRSSFVIKPSPPRPPMSPSGSAGVQPSVSASSFQYYHQQQQNRPPPPPRQRVTFVNDSELETYEPVYAKPVHNFYEQVVGKDDFTQRQQQLPPLSDSFHFFEFRHQQHCFVDEAANPPQWHQEQHHHQRRSMNSDAALLRQQQQQSAEVVYKQMQLMRQEIDSLETVVRILEGISNSFVKQTLKRECHGVWTTFITAVDRLASIGLLFMFTMTPVYLFWYYPTPTNYRAFIESVKSSSSSPHNHHA